MKLKTQIQILSESINAMKKMLNSDSMTQNLQTHEHGGLGLMVSNQLFDSILYIIEEVAKQHDIEHIKFIYDCAKNDMAEGLDLSGEQFFNANYELGEKNNKTNEK